MRTLILLGVVVAGLIAAGVIHIQKGSDTINITVDQNKLHQTEEEAVKLGGAVLKQAEQQLNQASKATQTQTQTQ
jgi:hypothetical protein